MQDEVWKKRDRRDPALQARRHILEIAGDGVVSPALKMLPIVQSGVVCRTCRNSGNDRCPVGESVPLGCAFHSPLPSAGEIVCRTLYATAPWPFPRPDIVA